ncbi:hypothetical protein F444_22401 [Phytophthora nicotianae P1976]|uniref:Uncharacterized protein n=1 Tax=Phytophthora nicotianae P1976 TaxID=1317066 RepID=A0A080YXW7_PHYNI|nr:hypothetical protein F444_22401 [Phytophthora nicotianae P1976]
MSLVLSTEAIGAHIRENEPPPPSTRSTNAQSTTVAATQSHQVIEALQTRFKEGYIPPLTVWWFLHVVNSTEAFTTCKNHHTVSGVGRVGRTVLWAEMNTQLM